MILPPASRKLPSRHLSTQPNAPSLITPPRSVVIAGGLAANKLLREQLSERLPIDIEYAPMALCTDNAAMIATLAYYQAQAVEPTNPRNLEVSPSLSMSKTAWAGKNTE